MPFTFIVGRPYPGIQPQLPDRFEVCRTELYVSRQRVLVMNIEAHADQHLQAPGDQVRRQGGLFTHDTQVGPSGLQKVEHVIIFRDHAFKFDILIPFFKTV